MMGSQFAFDETRNTVNWEPADSCNAVFFFKVSNRNKFRDLQREFSLNEHLNSNVSPSSLISVVGKCTIALLCCWWEFMKKDGGHRKALLNVLKKIHP